MASAAKLQDASVVAIYELGEHAGLPFTAAQWLDGDKLALAIQQQRPSTLLAQVTEGLTRLRSVPPPQPRHAF